MKVDWLPLPPDTVRAVREGLCVRCKASKMLCGKPRCPLLVRYHSLMKTVPLLDLHMAGSSPPGLFVGRYGYPKLNIGPLLPPYHGDTTLLDRPESWIDLPIDDFVGFRSQLVRGLHRVHITEAQDPTGIVGQIQELAVAGAPSDVEVDFTRRPRGSIAFTDDVQPHGPTGPFQQMSSDVGRTHDRLEKVWYDEDLKAREGMLWLHGEGVEVSRISRALSAGVMGLRRGRRLVPTRWSITAVDDTVGKRLVERVKDNPLINEFRVYESWRLDNRFLIFLFPRAWRYELVEAWYPGSTWNPHGREIAMFADWEGYRGRTTYAEIGGCYYAARLAIAEALTVEGRQAGALVLREAHPGYIMPVGVWNVRENVRRALRQPYVEFPDLAGALYHISTRLEIPLAQWRTWSAVLRHLLYQRQLEDFIRGTA